MGTFKGLDFLINYLYFDQYHFRKYVFAVKVCHQHLSFTYWPYVGNVSRENKAGG